MKRKTRNLLATATTLAIGSSVVIYALERYKYQNTPAFSLERAGQTALAVGGSTALILLVKSLFKL